MESTIKKLLQTSIVLWTYWIAAYMWYFKYGLPEQSIICCSLNEAKFPVANAAIPSNAPVTEKA